MKQLSVRLTLTQTPSGKWVMSARTKGWRWADFGRKSFADACNHVPHLLKQVRDDLPNLDEMARELNRERG